MCWCCLLYACTADTDGFVKVLSDAETDRILGIHMIGSVSAYYVMMVVENFTLDGSSKILTIIFYLCSVLCVKICMGSSFCVLKFVRAVFLC